MCACERRSKSCSDVEMALLAFRDCFGSSTEDQTISSCCLLIEIHLDGPKEAIEGLDRLNSEISFGTDIMASDPMELFCNCEE